MRENPTDTWVPVYKVSLGGNETMVPLADFQQKECPISIIDRVPQMEILARELIQAQAIRAETGAIMFGSDMAEWSCQWYDLNRLMVAEGIRLSEAIDFFKRNNMG